MSEQQKESIDEKIENWSRATRNSLLFYEVARSFEPSSEPDSKRRLVGIGKEGEKRLGNSVWRTGKLAIDTLLANLRSEEENRPPSLAELCEVLPSLFQQTEVFLDEDFYPDIVKMAEQGRIVLDGGNLQEFKEYWAEYRLPAKALLFINLIQSNSATQQDSEAMILPIKIAALAILQKIDECILESFEPDPEHGDTAMEIEQLRSFIMRSRSAKIDLESMKKIALSERGVELALRRHQKGNDARQWVWAEWTAHQSSYDNNKSAFTRDYVRRLRNEFDVSITEKQMREVWLKDTPPASKPDGVPVDGE